MTRYIATLTREKAVFRKISKMNKALTIVGGRLYRTDDALCVKDAEKTDCFVLYDLDEQQPYGHGEWLDPDYTKALIDSLKLSKGRIDKPFDLPSSAVMLIVAGVVGISILSTVLVG